MTVPQDPQPSFVRKKSRLRWLRWFSVPVLLIVLGLMAVQVLFKAYKVPTPSMQPTIETGDRILMKKGDYAPKVGDVVVFNPPAAASDFADPAKTCKGGEPKRRRACEVPDDGPRSPSPFVQRIVAGPGDLVKLKDGRVTVDGVPEAIEGLKPCTSRDCTFQGFTVPDGHWFVLGDDRANSFDSRFWGPVAPSAFQGPVALRYWPLSGFGKL